MRFEILGPVRARDERGSVVLTAPTPLTLLAILLCRANTPVPVSVLADSLWAGEAPVSARKAVQIHVHRLRRALGDTARVRFEHASYALRVLPGELDAERFETLLAEGTHAADSGDPVRGAELIREGLRLWGGDPFGELVDVPPLRREADRLIERRVVGYERLYDAELAAGRHAEVLPELAQLASVHPLRERLQALLMTALYRDGRQADALEAYRRTRRVLVDELAVEPGPELSRLHTAILTADSSLDTPERGPSARGMAQGRPSGPAQLPADITDFSGRTEQLGDLCELLSTARRGARAVVIAGITGKPGVGKTTLAVRAAHLLRSDFPDGQLYANLRGAEDKPLDPGEVLAAFLRALGVDGTVIPEDIEERAALYRSRLADRKVLVLLDDVASDAQVRPLLPGSPGCAVLTTSRPRLTGVVGTHLLDLDILSDDNAVELLANVAGQARVSGEPGAARVIARLCGFLPLALRIAAGRLAARPHWPLSRMAAQLNDEHGRLDELRLGELGVRASLALSYQVLGDTARRAFRRLGMLDAENFTGWLCAALLDIPPRDAEAVLDELVDAQLLDVAGTDAARQYRYRFHDLVRVYARERACAEETEEELDATLHRTLGAWLALAEQANRELQGPAYWVAHGEAPRWYLDPKRAETLLADPFGWFESERVALVKAVEQACEVGSAGLAWDLANSLAFFVELRGYIGDWRHTHELALAAAKRGGDRRGQGVMLRGLGRLHTIQGRYDDARRCLDAASAAFSDVRDRHGEAQVRCRVGLLERALRRPAAAERCFTEALVAFRQLGDQPGQAFALHLLGVMHLEQGRYADATLNLDAGLAGFRATGYRTGEALVLHRLGVLHQARGHLDEAVSALRRCLVILDELGERHEHAEALAQLASVYFDQGRRGEALRLLQRCLATFRELGERHSEGRTLRSLGRVYSGIGDEEAARACREQAVAVFRELGVREADELAERSLVDNRTSGIS